MRAREALARAPIRAISCSRKGTSIASTTGNPNRPLYHNTHRGLHRDKQSPLPPPHIEVFAETNSPLYHQYTQMSSQTALFTTSTHRGLHRDKQSPLPPHIEVFAETNSPLYHQYTQMSSQTALFTTSTHRGLHRDKQSPLPAHKEVLTNSPLYHQHTKRSSQRNGPWAISCSICYCLQPPPSPPPTNAPDKHDDGVLEDNICAWLLNADGCT